SAADNSRKGSSTRHPHSSLSTMRATMKYIYAILPAMLIALQSSTGQTVPQETFPLSEVVPPQGKNPIPDDVVLGPAAGSALSIGLFGGIISSSHSGTFTVVED